MKRVAAALCLVSVCSLLASAQAIRFPAPIDFQTHFEPNPGVSPSSGSRDGWESYPLSQEAGYDPSIQPESSNGISVLARELAPTRDGFFQLGFVRRVRLLSGDHASVRFRLRAPFLTCATTAHLHIFRGEADEQHDFSLATSDWQQLSTRLNISATPITAIAIAVDFPRAVHTRPERVLLTGLHLEALATKHILITGPPARWDATRELFYLQRSLAAGEELTLYAQSSNAHWTLTTPGGEVVRGASPEFRYRLPSNAQPGIWTIHFEDATAESTALLLVRPAHPIGLIFNDAPAITPQLLASIRERKAQLDKITVPDAGRNVALMNTEWLLPGLPSYFAELLQPSELALMDAMLFRATGDRAALDQARMLLTIMASWPAWVHPWFPAHGYHSYYPVGLMTKYIVMAEEFLGPDLPAGDRALLDHSLIALSVRPVYQEYVEEDRLQFNTSNWIGNTVGGALLAALASSDPETAGYALGLFTKERDHVVTAYTPDGSYGEGITYHRFDLETTELAAAAAKRLLGVSVDQPLLNGERYMRYAAFSPTGLLDYGDSHVDLKPANVFAYIAALNLSAATTDFYFQNRDEGTAQILPRVLWESQIKRISPPASEPTSALFAKRGVAILRDNWQPGSTVIAMRAGKNFNHNHADQGSLFYASHGLTWIGEAGYADYYKDPFYLTFNIQAIGHNTLLVDSNPESQILAGNDILGAAPRFTHTLFSDQASIVQTDLTSVYQSLTHYVRTLIHFVNGPTIVLDDVASATPRTFTAIWHPEQEIAAFTPEDNRLLLSHESDQLEFRAFADTAITFTLQPSPFPLAAYERSEHGPIHASTQLEVSTIKPSTEALLVTVLDPHSGEAHAPEATWKLEGSTRILTAGNWTLHLVCMPHHPLSITASSTSGVTLDLTPSER